jgi:putative toxin-antitoxin system antitoxin component (TIGR02293 family)
MAMAERQYPAGKAKTFKRTVSFKHADVAKHTSGKAKHADLVVEKTRPKGAKHAAVVVGKTLSVTVADFEGRRRAAGEKSGSRVKRSVVPGAFSDDEEIIKALRSMRTPPVLPSNSFDKLEKGTLENMMDGLQETLDLLGGPPILGPAIQSELDAHELLHRGLPRAALRSLIDKIHLITTDEAFEALGLSLRTLQRHKSEPGALLDVQQSGRAWKFAEILAKATRVLGSQDEAEQWLRRPAIGLDRKRPIDLLTTPAGVKLVEDYLERLEYDVYT